MKSLEWAVVTLQTLEGENKRSEKSVCQVAFAKSSPKTEAPRKNMKQNFLNSALDGANLSFRPLPPSACLTEPVIDFRALSNTFEFEFPGYCPQAKITLIYY